VGGCECVCVCVFVRARVGGFICMYTHTHTHTYTNDSERGGETGCAVRCCDASSSSTSFGKLLLCCMWSHRQGPDHGLPAAAYLPSPRQAALVDVCCPKISDQKPEYSIE
jgi:hypothetical protein